MISSHSIETLIKMTTQATFSRNKAIGISATVICLFLSTTTTVFGQTNNRIEPAVLKQITEDETIPDRDVIKASLATQSTDSGIIVLSHRYDSSRFSSDIKGEVLNNSSRSYYKYDINIYANFYDPAGVLVTSEQGFINAETLDEGDRSAFNVFVFDDGSLDDAVTYDLLINDERLVQGAYMDEDEAPKSNNDGEDSDNDGDRESVGCSTNLECQLSGDKEWAIQHVGGTFDNDEERESAMNDALDDIDEDYLDEQEEKGEPVDLSKNDVGDDEEDEEDSDG
jgi:hypothetical protein